MMALNPYDLVIADLRARRAWVQLAINALEALRPDLRVCVINFGKSVASATSENANADK